MILEIIITALISFNLLVSLSIFTMHRRLITLLSVLEKKD
jgi:hypothetical protein